MVVKFAVSLSLTSLMALLGAFLQNHHIIEHPAMWTLYGAIWGAYICNYK